MLINFMYMEVSKVRVFNCWRVASPYVCRVRRLRVWFLPVPPLQAGLDILVWWLAFVFGKKTTTPLSLFGYFSDLGKGSFLGRHVWFWEFYSGNTKFSKLMWVSFALFKGVRSRNPFAVGLHSWNSILMNIFLGLDEKPFSLWLLSC